MSPFRKGDLLFIELPRNFVESRKTAMVELIAGGDTGILFIHFLQDLKKILKSGSVKKLLFSVSDIEFGFAELFEIVKLIREMKEKGIQTAGFADSGNLKTLYFLSYLDERFTSLNSEFHPVLPSSEAFFVKGALKKLGIEVENFASGKHKAFAEMFTREGYSAEAKENITQFIDHIKTQIFQAFIENTGRKWTENDFPVILSGQSLQEKGFFKGFLEEEDFYENRMYSDYKKPEEKDSEKEPIPDFKPMSFRSFYFVERRKKFRFFKKKYKRLSIVSLRGEINQGKKEDFELKEGAIQAYPVVQLLRSLRKDESVSGVILDIDSPGGSAIASDMIYNEVLKLRKDKKVYVYMKNVSASGGYYIACAGEKIYTNPFCLTGSIGTVMVRPNFSGLYKKLGITKDRIGFYPTRDVYSEANKLSKESKAFLISEIERFKNIFYTIVQSSRKLDAEQMESRGGGRIFSGGAALELSLVDSTEGLLDIIDAMQKDLGLKDLKWEYIVPTYSFKSMVRNWRTFVRVFNDPLDVLFKSIPKQRLEYRSWVALWIAKFL
jgi:protease IV